MIADFRHRVTLEDRVRTADGGGGASESWTPVATLWASVQQKSGKERETADRLSVRTTTEIIIRHRSGVIPQMRFRQGTRLFNISSVLDTDGRGRFLTCLCEEGSSS